MQPKRKSATERNAPYTISPMFKTIKQMSLASGIGEAKPRQLVENGEIEYLPVGNRKLLAVSAVWKWYELNKVCTVVDIKEGEKNGHYTKESAE